MSALVFESAKRVVPSAPERADIALFVGFCKRRPGNEGAVPASVARFLVEQGFSGRFNAGDSRDPLLDVPVLVERWEVFERLFVWNQEAGQEAPGMYLGAAVRSFFAQGGRKCYVVRMGDSYDLGSPASTRRELLNILLPGRGALFDASAVDRSTWHGAAHVLGLSDVAFLCVPDLSALCSADPLAKAPEMPKASAQEVFVPCSEPAESREDMLQSELLAPRCDDVGYRLWGLWLSRARALVSRLAREAQLIAAIPLPRSDAKVDTGTKVALAEHDMYAYLVLSGVLERFESRFVQLVYPWVKTHGSKSMPEGLESPEGVLSGVLARNALSRGTVRNALGLSLGDVQDVYPVLSVREQESKVLSSDPEGKTMLRRISLMGPTPLGLKLLSDVSTSLDERFRQAHVGRLFSALSRALRTVGADTVFEPSGERTWGLLVRKVEGVLERMWRAGGLRGETARQAFSVRCDRTTMTQNDLDSGRLVAEVDIAPAAAIERIYVAISLSAGGGVVLEEKGAP